MADGRDSTAPGFSYRTALPWTEIFRCFPVALDPRKLLVAAVGILVMALGWYVLSAAFYSSPPQPDEDTYSARVIRKDLEGRKKPDGTDYSNEELDKAVAAEADRRYAQDRARWKQLAELAGPGGALRTWPWVENRGPNPYLFATQITSQPAAEWGTAAREYVLSQAPVLAEPLVKLLLPVIKFVSPDVGAWTKVYLLLVILWTLAVWAYFGGIITRLAAVQLANKGPVSLRQAARFVAARYTSYFLSPVAVLLIVAVVVFGLIVFGLFGLIPFVGDLFVYGLGLPLVIVGGAVMAVFLVGLVGYPLMYPTLSAEGDSSDTFDALSRSVNYVYQSPWSYLWYWLVAIVYGAAVTFVVLFFASLMVYLGKWAVSQTPFNETANRRPDYLFIYAPESFGWRELLLRDSPYAVRRTETPQVELFSPKPAAPGQVPSSVRPADAKAPEAKDAKAAEAVAPAAALAAAPAEVWRRVVGYTPVDPALRDQNRAEFWWYNNWGAGLVAFWLTLLFLMMVGFTYSFFWSAATMIYLLMRQKIDEAETDEVFVEEDEPEAPVAPPKIAEGTTPAAPATSLPVITPPPAPAVTPAPAAPPAASPPVVVSPPPPATIPFGPTGPGATPPVGGDGTGPKPDAAPPA